MICLMLCAAQHIAVLLVWRIRSFAVTSRRSFPGHANNSSPTITETCSFIQVVSQLLSKSPVQCIGRIKQLNVVGGLIDNINSFAMAELLLLLASLPEDPKVSVHLPGK
jgi:hypothetical protein